MKVLIIEDEKLAAERLKSIIEKNDSKAEVLKIIDSVEESVKWLEANSRYDLVFMDIQLADGISFEIFEQTQLKAPVIFTTAFDEYAVRAFKVNSIDYILKPYNEEDISKAIEKFKTLTIQKSPDPGLIEKMLLNFGKKYKNRFVVKVGEHIRFIATEEACYFYSLEKCTFIQHNTGKTYGIDYTLDQLDEMLDPSMFFRINRKYIININSILDIISFTNSRLKLKLKQCSDDDIIVSRERVQDFKAWLEG